MGNCCSDEVGGRTAVGGTASSLYNIYDEPNDAVNSFLRSRDYCGIFSQIELSYSASNLRDRDVFSKSDPMVVIYTRGRDGTIEEFGRTEVILNSLNPKWIRKHTITFHFEVVQTLVFRVYDVDTQFHNLDVKMLKLDEQQYLGEATCALSEIVTKADRSLTLDLIFREDSVRTHSYHRGKLTVCAEECFNSKTTAEVILRCSELDNKDLFSKSDPFLVISRFVESGIPIPVCKTEVIKNDLKPTWNPIFLNIQQAGSKDSPLIIECLNFNSSGKHDLIGKVQKSLADLEKLHLSRQGENLSIPTTVGRDFHNKIIKGQLFVEKYSENMQHTFLDYLAGGCELNFMVAVDFTGNCAGPAST